VPALCVCWPQRGISAAPFQWIYTAGGWGDMVAAFTIWRAVVRTLLCAFARRAHSRCSVTRPAELIPTLYWLSRR